MTQFEMLSNILQSLEDVRVDLMPYHSKLELATIQLKEITNLTKAITSLDELKSNLDNIAKL